MDCHSGNPTRSQIPACRAKNTPRTHQTMSLSPESMQELTEKRAIALCNLPLWMALMNVYPRLVVGQHFFAGIGLTSLLPKSDIRYFYKSGIIVHRDALSLCDIASEHRDQAWYRGESYPKMLTPDEVEGIDKPATCGNPAGIDSGPVAAVEGPILDSFGEVGDGEAARHLRDRQWFAPL